MGQKFSALKVRKASKQTQCPTTLDEPTNELLSWEDDYAVPSSNDKFSSIDTSSKALHPIPELEAETAPTTLPNLCTELILDIAEYLPPSSHVSLSYTCRTMRNKMGVSFAELLGDGDSKGRLSGSTLSIESRNVRYIERWELWSMLVHDRKIPGWLMSSRGYPFKTIGDYSLATAPLYAPVSREHRCLWDAGLLWVCPHHILDYNEAKWGGRTRDHHTCGSTHIFLDSSHGFFSREFTILRVIMRVSANSVPTCDEVEEALRPLNAPICPHLRLNDANVARIYDSECLKLRLSESVLGLRCPCSICLSRGFVCNYCDTTLSFSIAEFSREEKLCLFISRTVRWDGGRMDRNWIAQTARPTDFEDYERTWEATNAECSRRIGSSFDGW